MNYSTSSGLGGTTDSKGQFYYNPGDMVSFSLGGTSLGSVKAVPVLTPVTVIGATDTSDPRVVNMSRLLQSLDDDGDPSNGIGICESTRESLETTKIDFDQPVSEFESSASAVVTASVGRPMVSVQKAMTHLHNTMKDEGLDNNVADESKFKAITPNFDGKPPKLLLDKRIPAYLKEQQPKITISADEAGSIRYLGNCSGDKSLAVRGDNEITLNELVDGVYRCGLVVTDDVGNNSDKLFFGDFTVDTVPPELKVSAQVFPLTNDNTPEFVMVASEASTIIYSGGCQSQTAEAVAGENRITLNRLTDGKYSQCKLQLKDPTGHLSSLISLTSFQVDKASPKLKLLDDIANFTNTSTPSIRFSSNEPGSIRYLDECSSSSNQAVAGENTITLNALGDGQYGQCRITVTDGAGNMSTLQTAAFVVDTSPLAV
ncbi:MAG: Ig-like domain-containing protein, partial [SAR324 cluster bacterium]|nr:Ig-like domain-containing protein [SAR324 cluster bacterium]